MVETTLQYWTGDQGIPEKLRAHHTISEHRTDIRAVHNWFAIPRNIQLPHECLVLPYIVPRVPFAALLNLPSPLSKVEGCSKNIFIRARR